jgi:two-component system, NtrC family, sensor kinase
MKIGKFRRYFTSFDRTITSPYRYKIFRRNIVILMFLVTFIPLLSMAVLNYFQYQHSLKKEIINPLRLMSHKTAHSMSLFIEERLSSIRALAATYSFQQLSNQPALNDLYRVFKKEFGGFVDLGVINSEGVQVAYAGPYDLLGKEYSTQKWFFEVAVRSVYVSEVFMGHREIPHIVIAVQQFDASGQAWFLRATIDTRKFDEIIESMGLTPESDAFLINRKNVLQTQSKIYGNVLENFPYSVPSSAPGTYIVEEEDVAGQALFISYTNFAEYDYRLVVIKPQSIVLKSLYALEKEMLIAFLIGALIIVIAVIKTADFLVKQIKLADEKRESAFRELENSQKLSSIGRLAAGVAHEINNPMAIINQKSGLMRDLIEFDKSFKGKEKFLELTDSIQQSVERCKKITHRLLGFARRMEVVYEKLDINEVIVEVLGFLEKEALYREVIIDLRLSEELPKISSDIGQLQQVFLNIITNSLAAVNDGGQLIITSRQESDEMIAVSIGDNGCGMSKETVSHIFEPFFTTKKGYGTGLGLPITYGIVEKLGGKIEVDSTQGKGTTFTVLLKIDQFNKEEMR